MQTEYREVAWALRWFSNNFQSARRKPAGEVANFEQWDWAAVYDPRLSRLQTT